MGDLFEIKHYGKQRSQSDLVFDGANEYNYVMQNESNNGVVMRVPEQKGNDFNLIEGNSIVAFTHLNKAYYQKEPFYSKQGSNVYTLRNEFLNLDNSLYLVTALNKAIGQVDYGKNTASRLQEETITLPVINNQPDYDYMANYVRQVEAYLTNLGYENIEDVELTNGDYGVIEKWEKAKHKEFGLADLFDNIQQGKRLTKADQRDGGIPFIMAGTTNTGIVKYISNPARMFPDNSLTIDIFGNVFYRNYPFGAGDDTGVYWNGKHIFDKPQLQYISVVLEKMLIGKFSYGKKLRSSQSKEMIIKLPVTTREADYQLMHDYIKVIEKKVVKNLKVELDRRLEAYKDIIN